MNKNEFIPGNMSLNVTPPSVGVLDLIKTALINLHGWALSPLHRWAVKYTLKVLEFKGLSVVKLKELDGAIYIENRDGSFERIGGKRK